MGSRSYAQKQIRCTLWLTLMISHSGIFTQAALNLNFGRVLRLCRAAVSFRNDLVLCMFVCANTHKGEQIDQHRRRDESS